MDESVVLRVVDLMKENTRRTASLISRSAEPKVVEAEQRSEGPVIIRFPCCIPIRRRIRRSDRKKIFGIS